MYVALPPLSSNQIVFQVRVARVNGLGAERCPPEISVKHDAGGINYGTQRSALQCCQRCSHRGIDVAVPIRVVLNAHPNLRKDAPHLFDDHASGQAGESGTELLSEFVHRRKITPRVAVCHESMVNFVVGLVERHFKPLYTEDSGRGSAWLERLVRDQEVGGSNPLAPTISPFHFNHLRTVQKRRFRAFEDFAIFLPSSCIGGKPGPQRPGW